MTGTLVHYRLHRNRSLGLLHNGRVNINPITRMKDWECSAIEPSVMANANRCAIHARLARPLLGKIAKGAMLLSIDWHAKDKHHESRETQGQEEGHSQNPTPGQFFSLPSPLRRNCRLKRIVEREGARREADD